MIRPAAIDASWPNRALARVRPSGAFPEPGAAVFFETGCNKPRRPGRVARGSRERNVARENPNDRKFENLDDCRLEPRRDDPRRACTAPRGWRHPQSARALAWLSVG